MMDIKATNHQNPKDLLCFAVNGNDYLQYIYLYNAQEYRYYANYGVSALRTDGQSEDLGMIAHYDPLTFRIVVKLPASTCLSKYQSFTLTGAN